MAVSLVPAAGTLYRPGYTRTAALLDASSVAQIWLLSYGLRLPAGVHVWVNLVQLLLALAADPAVCSTVFPGQGQCWLMMSAWQVCMGFVAPCLVVWWCERRARQAYAKRSRNKAR